MKKIDCITREIISLSPQIYCVRLSPVTEDIFPFTGGQYLFLSMPDGMQVPLSIASSPEEKTFIELHIRITHEDSLASQMLELFQSSKQFQVSGPSGKCVLNDSNDDVVIIAGGTGMSPMKSILESAFANKIMRQFSLFLGAQTSAELYVCPLATDWEKQHPNFKFYPVIDIAEENWQGDVGFPHQVAIKKLGDKISQCDFYLGGSANMVLSVYHDLLLAGALKHKIFGDMLDIKREMGEID
ncbi:FAD-binding oxidoreductase [Aliikangiella maris]|uniref:FAD-binding oxidoreductase n=2 Tax=Aliikangiella maris TaxID=3162458 RepID=A0ABV2BW20_9GAMM